MNAAAFSERAAYYLGEINALHPFREGNGRVQREFIDHLAYHNGYFIQWKNVSQADMIQAAIDSFQRGDNTKFAGFIRDNLRKLPSSGPDDNTTPKKRKSYPEPPGSSRRK